MPRLLIVYAIAVPLALVLGLLLATPNVMSLMMIGTVLFVLSLPILIKWHHLILIIFWNAAFNVFFLPGQPHFWLGLAVLSFGFSWLNSILGRKTFLRVPELTRPMLFLAAVVALTALYRGGIGIRALGGSLYGGKNYVYVTAAIIGYFALTAQRIPVRQAGKVAAVYFLSGLTFALSNLVFALGPAFYVLFFLLPVEFVAGQVWAQASADPHAAERLSGLAPASLALICFFLLRWGVRGLFSFTRPWRFALFCAASFAGSFGGFRSSLILIGLLFLCQFFFEGLVRTRYLAILMGLATSLLVGFFFFADRLPLQLQRAVSFLDELHLPVNIDPSVRADAMGSTAWRIDMWNAVLPEIPRYLLVGKGYAIDPTDLFLAQTAAYRGQETSWAAEKVAGDYHNGPLSVIIPFGLWGAIGFLWLLWAGTKVLYRNYRYGDPALRRVNTLLLAFFVARAVLFLVVFGAFNGELCVFTGLLGLSVSLNGGVARQAAPVRAGARPALALAAQPA